MENRFEATTAPSGTLEVVGGICCEMTEFSGRASPRIPLKSEARGSESTDVAAAAETMITGFSGREKT